MININSININLKNRQVYNSLVLVMCLLFSGFFFFRMLLPRIQAWSALKKDIKYKEKELQLRYKTTQENQQLKQDIVKIEETYKDISRIFFAWDDIPGAVKEIADISSDLQIEFFSLNPQLPREIKEPSGDIPFSLWEVPISIRIKTGYSKLIDFIGRIEKSGKFIRIENLRIKKNPSTLQVHDVEMTVYIFSLQHEKTQ